MVTCSLMYHANSFRATLTQKACVCLCVWAHLCQSGLLMADFMLADGRQLLQRVAVVGQRPRQPSKLGPSCRSDTLNTVQITFSTTSLSAGTSRDTQRGRGQLSASGGDAVPQFMSPGTYWSVKIIPPLSLVRATGGLVGVVFPVGRPYLHRSQHDVSAAQALLSWQTATLQKVSLDRTGPPAAAGFPPPSCPMCSDLRVEAWAEGEFLLRGINTTRITDGLAYVCPVNMKA